MRELRFEVEEHVRKFPSAQARFLESQIGTALARMPPRPGVSCHSRCQGRHGFCLETKLADGRTRRRMTGEPH